MIFKTIPYKGGMELFSTEFFRTKAPHSDPRISVRLLKELEGHNLNVGEKYRRYIERIYTIRKYE